MQSVYWLVLTCFSDITDVNILYSTVKNAETFVELAKAEAIHFDLSQIVLWYYSQYIADQKMIWSQRIHRSKSSRSDDKGVRSQKVKQDCIYVSRVYSFSNVHLYSPISIQWHDANDFDRFYRTVLTKCDACEGFSYSMLYFPNASDILILYSLFFKSISNSWNSFRYLRILSCANYESM